MLNVISSVGTLPSFTQVNIFLTSSSHKRPVPGNAPLFAFSEHIFFGKERRDLGMVKYVDKRNDSEVEKTEVRCVHW